MFYHFLLETFTGFPCFLPGKFPRFRLLSPSAAPRVQRDRLWTASGRNKVKRNFFIFPFSNRSVKGFPTRRENFYDWERRKMFFRPLSDWSEKDTRLFDVHDAGKLKFLVELTSTPENVKLFLCLRHFSCTFLVQQRKFGSKGEKFGDFNEFSMNILKPSWELFKKFYWKNKLLIGRQFPAFSSFLPENFRNTNPYQNHDMFSSSRQHSQSPFYFPTIFNFESKRHCINLFKIFFTMSSDVTKKLKVP